MTDKFDIILEIYVNSPIYIQIIFNLNKLEEL